MIRRLNTLSDRHPVLSMLVGALIVWALAMLIIPPDPPNLGQAVHGRPA